MEYRFNLALVGFVLLVIPSLCLGLEKCYECKYFSFDDASDTNDEACENTGTNLPEKYLTNCMGNWTGEAPVSWQCIKVTGRIEVNDENYDYTHRFCSPGTRSNVTCKETKSYQVDHENFIKKGTHCVCDDADGCNTGSTVGIGAATFVAGLVATVLSKAWSSL